MPPGIEDVRFIDQIGQVRIDKLQSASLVPKGSPYGSPAEDFHFHVRSLQAVMSRDFPMSPSFSPNDEASLRMTDEGCPNESPSVDDATWYSKEEEEANSIGYEEVS
jgi:hypothetical protein